MEKIVKYFAWNAIVVGTLVLSSVFNWHTGIVLCGIFFGIEAATYFIAAMFPEEKLSDLFPKINYSFRAWRLPFEALWIGLAFYLDHPIIGICMTITLFGFILLWAKCVSFEKSGKTKES
jgi:hypothetical protein